MVIILAAILLGRMFDVSKPVLVNKAAEKATTTKSASEETTSNSKIYEVHENTTVAGVTAKAKVVNKDKNITKVTTTTEYDPTTGTKIKETTENVVVTNKIIVEDKESSSSITNDVKSAKTIETSNTTKDSTTEATTSEKTTEVYEEPQKNSRFGVAMAYPAGTLATYDVVKLGDLSLSATASIDVKQHKLSGVGAAALVDIAKEGRYYAGVYGEYKLQKHSAEVGVCAGVRF
jgi:hypothetical protein